VKTKIVQLWKNSKINKSLVIIIFLIAVLLFQLDKINSQKEEIDLWKGQAGIVEIEIPEDYEIVKQENLNLRKQKEEFENELEYLKKQKQKVKYIYKEKIKLIGQEQNRYTTLPGEYVFNLNNNIPIAKFSVKDNEYIFDTYDLEIKNTVIIEKDKTIVKTTATSSADNIEHPLDTKDTIIYENKLADRERFFKPRINIGAKVSSDLEPGVIIGLSFFEWNKYHLSFLEPNLSFNQQSIRFGITPVNYNLGDHLPLIENLWIGVGYETDINSHYGNLSLKGRL